MVYSQEMTDSFNVGDILASVRDWEIYRDDWLETLKKAKQTEPSKEQMNSLRDVFIEAHLLGRTSK